MDELYHYNHNHDPRNGQFTSRNGVASAQARIDKLNYRKKKLQNNSERRELKIQANEAILDRPRNARAAAKSAKYDNKINKVKSKRAYVKGVSKFASNKELSGRQARKVSKAVKLEGKKARADKAAFKAEQRISKQESKIAKNNAKIDRINRRLTSAKKKLVRAKVNEYSPRQVKAGKAEVQSLMKVYSEQLERRAQKASRFTPGKAQSLYSMSKDQEYLSRTARDSIEEWMQKNKKA